MTRGKRNWIIWAIFVIAAALPLIAALFSPLLAYRDPIYILAGVAGIIAMTLLFVQPLLAAGLLPGLHAARSRRAHLWTGTGLVAAVLLHVFGLWITSPPDVIDALTFTSPTPFSAWGVIAMWAVFASAFMAAVRRGIGVSPRAWRRVHALLAVIIVCGSVVHAVLIDGTMEIFTKLMLCGLVILAVLAAFHRLKIWRAWQSPRRRNR